MSVAEKVVIITGGAKGIGSGLVKEFHRYGAIVCAVDIDGEALELLSQSGEAKVIHADISIEADCARAIAEASQYGELWGLINNAGIAISGSGNVSDESMEAFDKVIAVNLRGTFMMSKFFAAAPVSNAWVVNIASTRAFQSEARTEAYAASKGGVVALTHALAASLGPRIRVNCVAPGWIDVSACRPGGVQEELTERDLSQHWVNRVGTPLDIAQACLYFATAGFVTGQVLVVDGGMTKKMIYAE